MSAGSVLHRLILGHGDEVAVVKRALRMWARATNTGDWPRRRPRRTEAAMPAPGRLAA